MRIRATVAAVSGALALSAFAMPAAQAAGGSSYTPADLAKFASVAQHAASGRSAYTASTAADTGTPYTLDLSFSSVKINKGKPIAAGIGGHVSVPVTFSVKHAADVNIHADDFILAVDLYRGSYDDPTGILLGNDLPTCTDTSTTTADCKGTIDIYPGEELSNADATTWTVEGGALALNGQDPTDPNIDLSKIGFVDYPSLTTVKLQRVSRLTVNATPEPVKKGRTITVTGKLTRANWDTSTYSGYANQSVKLQFRKKGSSTYTTLKTVKTSSTGTLKTTTKATVDGYYRYSFAGTSTTPAVSATGDYVDVK
ncbi:hypothetical protein [Streptomyces sp. NPDC101234]|uniref:hypothetical protein n=1 Tax=Streptomyces sp. NPDC101234 TaxID=3366138 RepID=UPI00381E3921